MATTFETTNRQQSDEGMPSIQKEEGKLTTQIEERTGRVPSGAYLTLAVASMVVSAGFMIAGRKQVANFIGQWAPTLLVIGVYNKLVKLEHELYGSPGYR
jgi:hypothetical protein